MPISTAPATGAMGTAANGEGRSSARVGRPARRRAGPKPGASAGETVFSASRAYKRAALDAGRVPGTKPESCFAVFDTLAHFAKNEAKANGLSDGVLVTAATRRQIATALDPDLGRRLREHPKRGTPGHREAIAAADAAEQRVKRALRALDRAGVIYVRQLPKDGRDVLRGRALIILAAPTGEGDALGEPPILGAGSVTVAIGKRGSETVRLTVTPATLRRSFDHAGRMERKPTSRGHGRPVLVPKVGVTGDPLRREGVTENPQGGEAALRAAPSEAPSAPEQGAAAGALTTAAGTPQPQAGAPSRSRRERQAPRGKAADPNPQPVAAGPGPRQLADAGRSPSTPTDESRKPVAGVAGARTRRRGLSVAELWRQAAEAVSRERGGEPPELPRGRRGALVGVVTAAKAEADAVGDDPAEHVANLVRAAVQLSLWRLHKHPTNADAAYFACLDVRKVATNRREEREREEARRIGDRRQAAAFDEARADWNAQDGPRLTPEQIEARMAAFLEGAA